ncbi:MAG: AMIN domain-containing protein [Candidatus Aminicenantes bacterium]|nr:MAG: AMIN domain-containing protein [Candidatus Aminicenantes bacterium]
MKKNILLPVLITFMSATLLAQAGQSKIIKKISIQKLESRLSVLIEFDRGISYESFTLIGPNRLVIDFMNVDEFLPRRSMDINSFQVKRIRIGRPEPDIHRLVFDLEEELPQYEIKEVDAGLEISFRVIKTEELKKEIKPPVEIKKEAKPPEKTPPTVEEKTTPAKEEKEPEKTAPKVEDVIEEPWEEIKEEKRFSIGVVTGLYFMQDEAFQETYGKSTFIFGGESSFTLPLKFLDVWISFKHMQDSGKTTFLEEDISLRMTDISLSLRYLIDLENITPFLGPGVDYIYYKESYSGEFPLASISDSEVGFHVQGGTYYHFSGFLSAKLYFKYNMIKTTIEDLTVNLGGTEWGLGLIFRF